MGKNSFLGHMKGGIPVGYQIKKRKQYNLLYSLIFSGGGGGSRTRVRKSSAQASTYLFRILVFVLQVPSGRGLWKLILIRVSLLQHQTIRNRYPASRRPSRGRERKPGRTVAMQLQRSYNRLRLYLNSHWIYERTGKRSVCSRSFSIPVEAVSPPWRKLHRMG